MENSYLKLYAKKRIVKNYFRCFCVSLLPFVSIFSLCLLNYYLFILLRQTNFSNISFISPYANYVRLVIMGISVILSFFIFSSVCLLKNNFFLLKSLKKKVSFFRSIKRVSFRQCLTFYFTSIIRFLLSVSWSTVYLTPSVAVTILLFYSYRYENYGYNVNLTLFVSAVLLFIIGISFLFVSLKRYSMCSYVVLSKRVKNPLKVIEESINLMEGNSIRYALYCLSFIGWVSACVLVIPTTYVLPYLNVGKWCFINSLTIPQKTVDNCEKPIIFYISSKAKKVGNRT